MNITRTAAATPKISIGAFAKLWSRTAGLMRGIGQVDGRRRRGLLPDLGADIGVERHQDEHQDDGRSGRQQGVVECATHNRVFAIVVPSLLIPAGSRQVPDPTGFFAIISVRRRGVLFRDHGPGS
jgi:hypothetical protein